MPSNHDYRRVCFVFHVNIYSARYVDENCLFKASAIASSNRYAPPTTLYLIS